MSNKLKMSDRISYHADNQKSPFSLGYLKGYKSLDDKPSQTKRQEYNKLLASTKKSEVAKAKGFYAYFRDLKKSGQRTIDF